MDRINSFSATFKYKGEFSFKKLYSSLTKYLKSQGYDSHESNFTDLGNEVEVEIVSERKVDEFAKYVIETHIHFLDIKKISNDLYYGRGKVEVKSHVELGYSDVYGTHFLKNTSFTKKLFKLYTDYIAKRELNVKYGDKLYNEVRSYVRSIKETLGMEVAKVLRDKN